MDLLLKQQPHPVADEKKELYEFMDRFINSVQSYRMTYKHVTDDKNADLKMRDEGAKNSLDKLAKKQAADEKKRLDKLNQVVDSCESIISQEKKKATDAIAKKEKSYTDFVNSERATLDKYDADHNSFMADCMELEREMDQVLEEVDNNMGKTLFGGNSKMDAILSQKPVDGKVDTKKDAIDILRFDSVDEARKWCEDIRKINRSHPIVKLFKTAKRNSEIIEIRDKRAKLHSARIMIQSRFVTEQMERQNKSQIRCKKFRKEIDNAKAAIIASRDKAIAAQNQEISKEKQLYQNEIKVMKNAHAQEYAAQKKHFEEQYALTKKNWEDKQLKTSIGFVKSMEEEYPAALTNPWLRQFWIHPRNVEDYGKIDGTQMNAMVGIASLDISSWYTGETAAPIRKALSNYLWLFGTNKESASKAFAEGRIVLPYSISIENGESLLISHDDPSADRAKTVVNAVGMRLLRSVPATMMRFQLFDADGIGAFGRLMALDPENKNNPSEAIVKSIAIGDSGKVHSTDISRQIEETKIMMDDLATQLTNYPSIREFNLANPLSKQIYRPILMMNFPSGLGEPDIRMLSAMSTKCSKWGFSMVLEQPDKEKAAIKPDQQRFYSELYETLTCVRMDSRANFLKSMNPKTQTEKMVQINFFGLPANDAIESIAAEIREKSVEASSVKITFGDAKGICPEMNERYNQQADDGIIVPVGYLEGGQPFKLQFDDKHVHTLIMGNTGSGKTNLLHVLMTNLMLRYDPSEVQIYLIDFKYGLDFRVYTQYNLPNYKSISITNDPEFALAMLEHLEDEQKKRSALMGSRYQKISDYNAEHSGNKMNRIVLIVDELYELVKQAPDEIQKKIIHKIDSFAHQTRAFGLHMVISGQDLDKIDKFETIKNQCTTRLALHCEDEQVKLLMADEGVARMHTIDATDQGACVFTLSAGKNPQIEHTALLASRQHEMFLKEIQEHYLAQNRITDVKVLLTRVSDNPNHRIQMFVDQGMVPNPDHNKMYVGDPISLDRELNFHPMENVWVAGGCATEDSANAANSLLTFAVLSMTMEKIKTQKAEIYSTNFNDHSMRSIDEEENDRFGQLTANFPKYYHYGNGSTFTSTLNELLDELEKRQVGESSAEKAIWWFVARPELLNTSQIGSNVIIDLKTLLQEGPKYNIHTVLWTADVKRAQVLQLTKTLFKERICLEMSSEECKMVNGEDMKSLPTGYKAVLIGQNTMKFRVYDLPDGQWMSDLFEQFARIS